MKERDKMKIKEVKKRKKNKEREGRRGKKEGVVKKGRERIEGRKEKRKEEKKEGRKTLQLITDIVQFKPTILVFFY